MILILDNLRSAHNVGALFRTADGAGVERIYLVGITPKPAGPDRLYRTAAEKTMQKTALGGEESVPWAAVKTLLPLIRKLKAAGVEIVALEEGENIDSLDYRRFHPKKGRSELALVVGSEVSGLDAKALVFADTVIHLPMHGVKNSLNVSVAGGIALYHLSDTMERLERKKTKQG
jgi:23S rRNA (guanosine2251-2'-O)-methyltransferase